MKLIVKKRAEKFEKIKENILGVVYGGDFENTPITFNLKDFEKIYQEVGTSGIVKLDIEGENHDVVIKDIQLDIASGEYYHIDFYVITKGQEMEVSVVFEFIGEASATKKDGIINISLNEIQVKALPRDLPKHLVVNLDVLKEIGDSIKLSDLKLPTGVKFLDGLDTEAAIVSIIAAKSVADEEEANAGEVEITPEESEEEKEENSGDSTEDTSKNNDKK